MTRRAPLAVLLVVAVVLVGCSSDDDADDQPATANASTTAPPSTSAAEPLQILVTNDDGVGAEGIDVLVNALLELPDVEVTVVAPADQQSGSSDATTPDPTYEASATASGVEATAVDGEPADAVRVALDELGVEPDVVVSGSNEGQNIGPAVELSGTIGAARTGARSGVPSLAVSQGFADEPDFDASVAFAVEWIDENRSALADGTAEVTVVSINAPTCAAGEVRGLVEVPVDAEGASGGFLDDPDCTSTLTDPTTDIQAFLNGYATLSVVGF